MTENPYQALAHRLDSTPNGFPPTPDGAELRILEYIFTPEQADLASQLRLTLETPEQTRRSYWGRHSGPQKAPQRNGSCRPDPTLAKPMLVDWVTVCSPSSSASTNTRSAASTPNSPNYSRTTTASPSAK